MPATLADHIRGIIRDTDLPAFNVILDESRKIASDISIGRTKFMDKYDVSSEYEYKIRCIKEKKIM